MADSGVVAPADPRESAIAGKICSRLRDRSTFFVFPSQIAADSWATAALGFPGISAVETERFLGWDTFLDRITRDGVPPGGKKADSASRLVWSLTTLARQAKSPFLKRIVKPGLVPSPSLAAGFAALAPSLRSIAASLRSLPAERGTLAWGRDEIDDFMELSERYSRFLAENSLYEPGHIRPALTSRDRYVIFEPALMPGLGELPLPAESGDAIEFFSGRGAAENKDRITLREYATFREEVRSVFAYCAALVDGGLQPEDIAVSVPALTPETQAHLALEARRFALPVDFRVGIPLSISPFGRLLVSLTRASSEGFSLRSLRKLFETGACGWRRKKDALELVRYGASRAIPEFSADRRYMATLWERTFSLCPPADPAVATFYAALGKAADSLGGARTFAALRRALHDFKDDFLEETDEASEATRTLERVFEELDALDGWHQATGGGELAAGPFDALLLALDASRYRSAVSANAISVYPYHLGALVASRVHFVLDASQDSLETALASFRRYPRELRAFLEAPDPVDQLLSSLDAVNAVYCHAERGLEGYSVPHPYFSRRGARVERIGAASIPQPPDAAESRAWRDSAAADIPARLAPEGLGAALGIFSPRLQGARRFAPPALSAAPDGSRVPEPSLLMKFPACDASPSFKISPYRLKSLMECPFKWFASCVPGLDGGPGGAANVAEGSLAHSLIRLLFEEIKRKDGSFRHERLEDYKSWIRPCFDRALVQALRNSGPALGPALESAFPKIADRIARILDYEKKFEAAGWDLGEFEVALSKRFDDLGLVLEGRADRICRRVADGAGGGAVSRCAIIDYKKRKTPKKKEYLIDKEGKLADFQIASYAAMRGADDAVVDLALYWSIEDCKPSVVFGEGGARAGWDDYAAERDALRAALETSSETIRSGAFMAIDPSTEHCAACSFRALCRAHFSSERV